MYEATAENRKPAISITTAMTALIAMLPVKWLKMKNSGITDRTMRIRMMFIGMSRSVRGIASAPSPPFL